MTLDELYDHVYDYHNAMSERYYSDHGFMPDFRVCEECRCKGVDYAFFGISNIMYHVQEYHRQVVPDVRSRFAEYWSLVNENQ